jgi:hypothetical protein
MPHKLLIEHAIEPEDKFRRFVKPNEAIRSEPCKISLRVKNLGAHKFPGGSVTSLSIEYPLGGLSTVVHTPTTQLRCPEINPDETKILYSQNLTPISEGLAIIKVKIEADDKEPIEYFQAKEPSPFKDEWYNFFYIVRREDVLILSILQQMLERGRECQKR